MHVTVKATLRFGLVSIPVGVCTAIKEHKTPLRTLHRDPDGLCNTPLNRRMWCESCGKNVADEEQGKGIEAQPGAFVYIEESEIEQLSADRSSSITINKFVDRDDISPVMIHKTYWLQPGRDMSQPYALFREALADSGKTALGVCTLWGTERPCRIHIEADTLCLQLLHCWDEFVIPDVDVPPADPTQKKLAAQIVKSMSGRINLIEDLVSESRENIAAFIDAKKAGMTIEFDKTAPAKPQVNLMDALKATLDQKEPKKPAARKPARKKAAAK